ncbi:hypothetical protein CSUI_004224 [Cystoisospora suis]|uniref:Uncharacterized protein n=1 Tax=Cystoisospora suis TaxID=483139 RepID=A0A2C6KCI5_9APIC|nr:hypothetical protein CSUI_004224 [Cystoisospora suis]
MGDAVTHDVLTKYDLSPEETWNADSTTAPVLDQKASQVKMKDISLSGFYCNTPFLSGGRGLSASWVLLEITRP